MVCEYQGTSPTARLGDMSPQELGERGELLCARYLERRGYEILERNWTCPYGEADIIARDDETCVFVEVKTRIKAEGCPDPEPELAVDGHKRQRYEHIASCYLRGTDIRLVRFDVVAISVVAEGRARLRHYVGAFGRDA